nr:latexin [Anolis sagrei ordinatus]
MGLLGGKRRRRGCWVPARFLLLLLLLLPASLAGSASASNAGDPSSSSPASPRSPGMEGQEEEIPRGNYPATRAARLVAHYINAQRGSPSRLFQVPAVHQARRERIPGVGNKYHLKVSLEEALQKGSPVNCTAEILYHHGDPHVAAEVHYTVEGELEINTDEADNKFYNKIKNLSEPLEAQKIPDNYGNMAAEMEPVRNLALIACAHVIWQISTEDTLYNLAQIESVKQVKRKDDYLEFSFVVLLHDMVSQEIIPWHMQVLWHPQHGVKVTQNSRQPKRAAQ